MLFFFSNLPTFLSLSLCFALILVGGVLSLLQLIFI